MAEEVKDPVKNVPRAILFAFALCTLIYIGVSVMAVGVVNWTLLGTSSAPLEFALKTITDNIFILQFVAISALFATTSVIMSSIKGGIPGPFCHGPPGCHTQRVIKNFVPEFPGIHLTFVRGAYQGSGKPGASYPGLIRTIHFHKENLQYIKYSSMCHRLSPPLRPEPFAVDMWIESLT